MVFCVSYEPDPEVGGYLKNIKCTRLRIGFSLTKK